MVGKIYRLGPRRKIVGEELTVPKGEKQSELFEVLECGHRQPGRYTVDGDFTAQERCCKGCRDGTPKGPAGRIVHSP